MESSQHALDRHGLIVLDKYHIKASLLKVILIVGLYKIASLILKYSGFNHIKPLDIARSHFNLSHLFIPAFLLFSLLQVSLLHRLFSGFPYYTTIRPFWQERGSGNEAGAQLLIEEEKSFPAAKLLVELGKLFPLPNIFS